MTGAVRLKGACDCVGKITRGQAWSLYLRYPYFYRRVVPPQPLLPCRFFWLAHRPSLQRTCHFTFGLPEFSGLVFLILLTFSCPLIAVHCSCSRLFTSLPSLPFSSCPVLSSTAHQRSASQSSKMLDAGRNFCNPCSWYFAGHLVVTPGHPVAEPGFFSLPFSQGCAAAAVNPDRHGTQSTRCHNKLDVFYLSKQIGTLFLAVIGYLGIWPFLSVVINQLHTVYDDTRTRTQPFEVHVPHRTSNALLSLHSSMLYP